MTTVVMGTSMVALGWMVTSANRTQDVYQEQSVDDLQLAREIRELALSVRKEVLNDNGIALTPAEVLSLSNLDGASFSPPIRADLSVMKHLTGWTQQVQLTQHALGTLATITKGSNTPSGSSSDGLGGLGGLGGTVNGALGSLGVPTSTLLTKPAKGAKEIYKLTVTILNGTTEMGTYEWMIKP
ncbi:MAG: hypothetical protein DHS20C15_26510 [Planctomycetota bacterium]|nr:MAG: hypothetical protein DHS20C15_26510 [Planctomycetota bacterium]